MAKTSKSDFEGFKKKAYYYVGEFGLLEYEIDFVHKDLCNEDEPLCNAQAGVRVSAPGKWATIYLNVDWGDNPVTKHTIHSAALHEVLHILFAEYSCIAFERFNISQDQFTTCEHTILGRLQNFILGR
jgi:hypothetical protein